MANQYVNHVIVNGSAIIDLRSDTVDAAHLMSGYTAHDKSGASITGTASGPKSEQSKTATANGTVYPDSGKVLSSVTVAIPVYDGTVI